MKVWISKYALTRGLYEVETEQSSVSDNMVTAKDETGWTHYFHGEGREWHRTEVSAIERAILMTNKRTNSLKKSLAKNQEVGHRFVAELEMVRKGLPKPPQPAKKRGKKSAIAESDG